MKKIVNILSLDHETPRNQRFKIGIHCDGPVLEPVGREP